MIIVFGSINMDMVIPVKHLPVPGETLISKGYEMLPGGKGANQALAAARMGAKVALVGRVGDDGTGLRMLAGLRRDGVSTTGVAQSENPTGMAIILTDEDGENEIIVASGANLDVTQDQVPDEILTRSALLLVQGETNPQETWALLERAHTQGTKTILNLAPVVELGPTTLNHVDYLIINEVEAEQLAAKLSPGQTDRLAQILAQTFNLTCIVTLGGDGAVAATAAGQKIKVPALALDKDSIVDRTGAGDAFCGTFAAMIHAGQTVAHALKTAAIAGSLACTKKGTQSAYAYLGDIQDYLKDFPEPVVTSY